MPNNPPREKPDRHKRNKYSEKPDDIIYTNQWRKVRAQYLELNPVCERCLFLNQLTYQSTINLSVHHIYRRNRYQDKAFDEGNLLCLCDKCHRFYDELERISDDLSIEFGIMIKTNYTKKSNTNRILLAGNYNSGKSWYVSQLKATKPNHIIIAFDDYLRLYDATNIYMLEVAKQSFCNDVRSSTNSIILTVGTGNVYNMIKSYVDYSILLDSTPENCYRRYISTPPKNRPPLINNDFASLDYLKSIDDNLKINRYDEIIDTNHLN